MTRIDFTATTEGTTAEIVPDPIDKADETCTCMGVAGTRVPPSGTPCPEHGDVAIEPAPFRVAFDNIVVELVQREDVTEGGVFLPDGVGVKKEPEVVVVGVGPTATIVFDGPPLDTDEGQVHVAPHGYRPELGDVLVIRKHQTITLTLGEDQRELLVLKPDAVIGLVE